MAKIKNILFLTFCLFFIEEIVSQNNNLLNSPYSLYGLGTPNILNTGKTNSMGNTGLAIPSSTFINNLNPASFASIHPNSFFYDIGLKAENTSLSGKGVSGSKYLGNVSNLAFAFPVTKNSGAGLILLPFTTVGYEILGIENNIEGSNQTFVSDINVSGGLNQLKLNYGYEFTDNFRLGLYGSYLFGSITEDEIDNIYSTTISISETHDYSGFRFGTGFQYNISDKIALGAIINFPTQLNGNQSQTVIIQETESIMNDKSGSNYFKLPLEIGFGISTQISESLFLNFDYKRNFWNETEQSDYVGNFVDQDIFGIGGEFTPNNNSLNYAKKIQYRAGINFDNGYLSIDGNRIKNYTLTLGMGLPFSKLNNSMLNIGYSYGKKGQVSNGLVLENHHSLKLNISLEAFWFIKRKIK